MKVIYKIIIQYYLTDNALEDDGTKEKKKHALNNSEKTLVDARESFEEDLKINT